MSRLHTDDVMCRSHNRDEIFIVCREKKKMRWSYVCEYADKDQMNHIKDIKKKNYQA